MIAVENRDHGRSPLREASHHVEGDRPSRRPFSETPVSATVLSRQRRFAVQTAKEEVQQLLQDLPDDATLEDIQYHIYVKQKIAQGLADVRAGRVMSQEEVEKRFARWLGK
jgi:hypothetical protein